MKKKWLLLALSLLLFVVACNGNENEEKDAEPSKTFNATGFPIVDDEITLKMFTSEMTASPDWNDDFPVWTEYEDMTNIKIDWEQIDSGSLSEKRNLALSSGQLPDVFFATQMPNSDLLKYGEQGTFIDLKDLIDEYAPNLKKLMEENPSIEKGMTFPDGNIYSLPYLIDNDFLSMRLGPTAWIDETWLDRLDTEIPETTEEFYDFLTAVKENDPDTFPYGGASIDDLVNDLNGSFGLNGNREKVDLDPNGEGLRFVPTSDQYRNLLEYMHKLYDEELIPQNIFTVEWDQFMANAAEGNYASIGFYTPKSTFKGEGAENFISFFPLEGPDGDQLYTSVKSPLSRNGQFVITNVNKHPVETIRWVDYFYSDEGSKLMYLGIEDESYVEENGEYRYSDKVLNSKTNPDETIREYAPGGGIDPPAVTKQDFFQGSESHEDSVNAAERIEPYLPEEVWPEFTYTKEENDFMNSVGNDIQKYTTEMRDKFIAGSESLDDKNWENYVKTLKDMNLEEYMEIVKTAYERYKNN